MGMRLIFIIELIDGIKFFSAEMLARRILYQISGILSLAQPFGRERVIIGIKSAEHLRESCLITPDFIIRRQEDIFLLGFVSDIAQPPYSAKISILFKIISQFQGGFSPIP